MLKSGIVLLLSLVCHADSKNSLTMIPRILERDAADALAIVATSAEREHTISARTLSLPRPHLGMARFRNTTQWHRTTATPSPHT